MIPTMPESASTLDVLDAESKALHVAAMDAALAMARADTEHEVARHRRRCFALTARAVEVEVLIDAEINRRVRLSYAFRDRDLPAVVPVRRAAGRSWRRS